MISGISGSLSNNEYLLVVGTANDGSGSVPFAVGTAAVPEPATLILAVAGGLTVAGYAVCRRRPRTGKRGSQNTTETGAIGADATR
jgi:hypothetical protein